MVGTPFANRQRAEVENLIGFFVTTLALRVRPRGDLTVAQLLAQVKADVLDAYANQDVPFEQVVEIVQPPRSLSHSPIFQAMLSLQNTPGGGELALPDLALSQTAGASVTAHFDLSLSLSEVDGVIRGHLEYASDLFEQATIERMAQHLQRLLLAMVEDDSQLLGRLPLLDAAQARQLLAGFNETAAEFPRERLVHQLFEAQAAVRPEADALVFGHERLSYDALNRRANRIAHALLSAGVQSGDRVAIFVERGTDMVAALLGVLKAGAAYVPVDPSYPAERVAFMLADCAPAAMLTHAALRDLLPAAAAPVLLLDVLPALADTNAAASAAGADPRSLAYVLYTSGVHRTAERRHGGAPLAGELVEGAAADRLQRVGYAAPGGLNAYFGFDSSLKSILQLLSGHCLVIVPQEVRAQASALLAFAEQYQLDALDCTPAQLELMLDEGLLDRSFAIGRMLVGGEAIGAAMWDKLRHAPSTAFYNVYGPTECTVDATIALINGAGPHPHIGRPIANARIYLLDAFLQPVPLGATGEIHIGGAGVARGYLNRAELTAERFIADPFSSEPGARLYKTGDLARYRTDGNIDYLGRSDFQIKIRGFRVELGEIEARLCSCAGVGEALVVAREVGPGDKRLVAYVTAQADDALDVAALRGELAALVPDYMVPAAFVQLDAFPLTSNGKVDRNALPAPAQSALATRQYEAPQGALECAIAAIWQDLLRVERIGRHDNFFELGGHSLLATQVVSKLRTALGKEVPLRALFEASTVESLAAKVAVIGRDALQAGRRAIAPVSREQRLPLSYGQQRLWFLDRFEPASASYNMPLALRLRGDLDIAALQAGMNEIVRRHEVLRTTFATVEGEAVQVIAAAAPAVLAVVDLTRLAEGDRHAQAQALAQEEARAPFDLATGPLLRTRLLKLGAREHMLLFTMHHIASDGWSVGVLVKELSLLYQAGVNQVPAGLPPLRVQYADYAHWQRGWLAGQVLEEQVAYWKEQLTGASALLELPLDFSRPAVQTHSGAVLPLAIDAGVAAGLHAVGRRAGATLFMTLAAAFNVLLARYSGQDDICIGTPIANRTQDDVEPLIGFFVNTLVLRTRVDGRLSFMQLLAQVQATTLDAYAHQELPFEHLVDVLKPERHTSHSPLFQVMLVLQNAPQSALVLPGLTLEAVATEQTTAKFDLTLSLAEQEGELHGSFEYNTGLFERATVQRMADHFAQLLRAIVEQPAAAVGALPLLTPAQRSQQLLAWNDTRHAYPDDLCIHALFEAQAARAPDAAALVFGEERLTYAASMRAPISWPGSSGAWAWGRTAWSPSAPSAVSR